MKRLFKYNHPNPHNTTDRHITDLMKDHRIYFKVASDKPISAFYFSKNFMKKELQKY